jgi:deoxyribodipyrimidine photo-lyase
VTTVVWWVRRDLRLHDNQALAAALTRARELVPLFVLDPALLAGPTSSQRRNAFLFAALRSLDAALRRRGSRLIVRAGRPEQVLPAVVRESGATLVMAEADGSPYARRRDEAVARSVPLQLVEGSTLRPLGSIRAPTGEPYRVYSQFRRAWFRLPIPSPQDILPAPPRLPPVPRLASEPIPESPLAVPERFAPSEDAARQRLQHFLAQGLASYHLRRNALDGSGSSQLSPYFRFGLLSVREAWCAAARYLDEPDAAAGARAWLDELLWREFYQHLLAAWPESARMSMQPEFRDVAWPGSNDALARWQEGRTGFPVVDAAMRQLVSEGWMSNRARMIVASFLSKLLLVDWREGERFFRRELVDGDLAANVGGWQWSAGTGTDAAPYFRIFNPVLQGEQHDPNGSWVRTWLPELANVPREYLFAPWRMPIEVQLRAGCRIGRDYPAPIVEYESARARALEWFRSVRQAQS